VTGACRTVVRESWPPSWAVVSDPTFLADGRRFIWQSDRTGFRNLYLYDLSGREIATLTRHGFEVVAVVKVDEQAGQVWYMARSGDNHMKVQLHRVGLDGRGDVRLTDPAFHHTVTVAPDGRHFIDVAQTHDAPPISRLMDAAGRPLAEIARSDAAEFGRLGLKPVELFTYKAADGVTDLHGVLHRPSNFDPGRSYPLLLQVYGGPGGSVGARETYTPPSALTEYGFLVAQLDTRAAGGRGRRVIDAIYKNLGIAEIDDLAAGVRVLGARPYVDARRVGIYGTSYGGYASAMMLARYPDLVQAAAASSPVTDWALYDSTYPERYMGLPQANASGYARGSIMTHLAGMRGDLMIYYGTADDNVHPKNALTLIRALQAAGKSFEVQVGPDRGHSAMDQQRMMEFFIERLGVVRP
jgi:dipeptidyl-peptidase-4